MKNIDRGAQLIFWAKLFLFWGVGKDSLTFLDLKIFDLIFWAKNCDAIYSFGFLIIRF